MQFSSVSSVVTVPFLEIFLSGPSRCRSSDLERRALSAALNLLSMVLAKDLLSRSLDDASSDWKVGGAFKVEIDFTSRLTTFVDTPD